MSAVNYETGEITNAPAYRDVRHSVDVARESGVRFFEQIVWQIEHRAWVVLGYESWDAMREAEYGDMGVVVPRADRPEIVARMRRTGMTQAQISATTGVPEATVRRDLNRQMADEEVVVTNSRGQQRPASYAKATQTSEAPDTLRPTSEPLRPAESVEPQMADLHDAGPSDQPGTGSIAATPSPRTPLTHAASGDHENAVQACWSLTRALGKLLEFQHPNMRDGMRRYWEMASDEVSPVQRADVTPAQMRAAAHGLLTLADEWSTP